MATKTSRPKQPDPKGRKPTAVPTKPGSLLPPSEPGYLSVASVTPPAALRFRYGPTAPQLSGGVGGWEPDDRPYRKAATKWTGLGLQTFTVELWMEGLINGRSVEEDIRSLAQLGKPVRLSSKKTPKPPVLALGGMVPPEVLSTPWVLQDISWTVEEVVWVGLERRRQFAVVTFLEYVESKPVPVKSPSASKDSSIQRAREVRVNKGDTLWSIARRLKPSTSSRELYDYVQELKRLNEIRDAKKALKRSTVLVPR